MEEESAGKAKVVRWLLTILVPTVVVLAFLALRQTGALARLQALQDDRNNAAARDVL